MIGCGIDAGSRAIKMVLFDRDRGDILAAVAGDQGPGQEERVLSLLERAIREAGLRRGDIGATVATGYGRGAVGFADAAITEITCQARGVHHLHPHTRTVLDIGGQDSKLIHLEPDGTVRDFVMNDRCAAGTGRFLEVVASRFEQPVDGLGELAARASRPAAISSMCVVFAETEITGLLAQNETPSNIAAGVQHSIASRLASMAGRRVAEPVVFTGGVALVAGMAAAIANTLGKPVAVADRPQTTGALGAAILASKWKTEC